ncbi:molybdenum cofactor guanylyltransferase [halophilic archaeon]|nr:molybdenum cofactor guanylyltransferase [halophilic archaeon]
MSDRRVVAVTEIIESDLNVVGLVLAGGQSSRFGDANTNKAVASLGTRTLLGRVVDVLTAATCQPPVVAVRTTDQREQYAEVLSDRDVLFVRDHEQFEGPLAGLYGAVDAVEAPWLFCCGCDMPLLSPAVVQWLICTLQDRVYTFDTLPSALGIRHSDGTINPLHTLYQRSAVKRLQRQLSPTSGPRSLLSTLDSVLTISEETAPAGLPVEESTTNVNTQRELKSTASQLTPIHDHRGGKSL